MSQEPTESPASEPSPRFGRGQVLYPNAYVWFVFVSAMDVFMTAIILGFGGAEVNPIADSVLSAWGVTGMVIFKFAIVLLVILLCELIGRLRHRTGRRLAYFAVGITAVPMVLAFAQLLVVG
jgi:hypothetical protein